VSNPGRILDEADKAYLGFLSAARESVTEAVDEEPAEEQLVAPTHLPAAVDEVASLDLTRENITTIIWATGYVHDYGWVKAPVFDVRGRPRSGETSARIQYGNGSCVT
jgi:putative flavoprotein involved in K+ transport